jgi:hypothetical protein
MSFEGRSEYTATPIEDRFFARIGNSDLTPIEVWRELAVKENRARKERDGPSGNAVPRGPLSKGILCDGTMRVLRLLKGDMATEKVAEIAGVDLKTASAVMQRLQRYGLAESVGFIKVMRKYGASRLAVWRVTRAGEAYRRKA